MPELVPCKHCDETGACRKGENRSSCIACISGLIKTYDPLKTEKLFYGIRCSVCGGLGQDEPMTFKWHNRFLPILTAAFVVLAILMLLVFGLTESAHFDKILVFAGTLIGSITGFYYGGERIRSLPTGGGEKPAPERHPETADPGPNKPAAANNQPAGATDPAHQPATIA